MSKNINVSKDEQNKDMLDFVQDKCVNNFYGKLTLRIQNGVIEAIEEFGTITRADVISGRVSHRFGTRNMD